MQKNLLIIFGESLLNSNSSKYLFNKIKEFLTKNNKITENDGIHLIFYLVMLQQLEILILE